MAIINGDLLNSQSKTIAASAVILAVSSIVSRLLGILRDWLLAERFGAGPDLDVYFAAFRIPDFIYNILVAGGIVVAFLPLFSEYYYKNKDAAWRFTNNTLNVFLVFLIGLSAILFIFTPKLTLWIAPGFTPDQLVKTILLSRLMFLSPIIFGVASIFSGILQYFHRFLAYSLAASLYNIGIIIGILFFAPFMGITGVAAGVIFGALLYLFVQVFPSVKCGYHYKSTLNFDEPSLNRVMGLMLPRTAGIAANQLNLIVPTIIGSTLAAGSITIFNLSNNVFSIPVGIIGVSWAIAAFAAFSKLYSENKISQLAQKFSSSYRQIGYLVMPASFLFFILRDPIIKILYQHGQFTDRAALLTSASLGLFCLGIYFSSLMPVIFRLFFAVHDTATPTWTTVISVAANIFLNYWLIQVLAAGSLNLFLREIFGLQTAGDISVLALALAYSLANILQYALLVFLLYFKNARLIRTKEIAVSFFKTLIASIVMSVVVYFISAALSQATALSILANLLTSSLIGLIVYALATLLLRSPELLEIIEKWKLQPTNQK